MFVRITFKMASPNNFKERVLDGIFYVVDGSKSNCLLKGVVSGFAGSAQIHFLIIGLGMGLSLAVFFGPFEGCHGDLPGNTMRERLAYASKQTAKCTWRRAKTLGGVGNALSC